MSMEQNSTLSRPSMHQQHNSSCITDPSTLSNNNNNNNFQYSSVELILSILLQTIGSFLILSTTFMFLNHSVLRKIENIFHMNILVCSFFLLFMDWYVLEFADTGCEIFTLSFLLFGSAGTFSTLCIAIERYKRMVHMIMASKRHFYIWISVIWITSVLLVLYPSWTTVIKFFKPSLFESLHSQNMKLTCFFTDSYLYASFHYSSSFTILALIMPVVIKIFCYLKIYQRVRRARINRWLHNAAARCTEHTRVIRSTQRKGNIIQLSKGQPRQEHRHSIRLPSREQSIIMKGVVSVLLDVCCWLPFAVLWVKISFDGFRSESVHYLQYFIILAKGSAILSISHYISLNNKFRRYYVKSTFGRLQCIRLHFAGTHQEDNTSHLDSSMNVSKITINKEITSHKKSRVFPLEPIDELTRQTVSTIHQNVGQQLSDHEVSLSTQSPTESISGESFNRINVSAFPANT